MSAPTEYKYKPQFTADITKSLAAIILHGEPRDIKTAVRLILPLVDVFIYNAPHRRLVEAPDKRHASYFVGLEDFPDDTVVWFGRLSNDFGFPQFPALPNASSYFSDTIAHMALYSYTCDLATIMTKHMLKAVLGDKWIIRRLRIIPIRKHIYVEDDIDATLAPRGNVVEYAANVRHTIIGIFSIQRYFESIGPDKSKLSPEYVVDPTILQYAEPNSKRFCTWEVYKNFVMPYDDGTLLDEIKVIEDAREEVEMEMDKYWGPALDMVKTWIDDGDMNLHTVTDQKITTMMEESTKTSILLATNFAFIRESRWRIKQREKEEEEASLRKSMEGEKE